MRDKEELLHRRSKAKQETTLSCFAFIFFRKNLDPKTAISELLSGIYAEKPFQIEMCFFMESNLFA